MSNYKGHMIGGCIAYGITLATIISFAAIFKQSPSLFLGKQKTLLTYLPSLLESLENTLHLYFPILIDSFTWLLAQSIPILLVVLEWLLCTLAGAMFPDIDIKSKSQKYLYSFLTIAILVLIGKKQLYTVALISILSLIPMFSNHRGLFHRLWFVILVPFSACCWLSFW